MSESKSAIFANKFYERLSIEEYDGLLIMEKESLFEILKEEIESHTKDTQAEFGMGIYALIQEAKKTSVSSIELLKTIENICIGLIKKSPESALEFSKKLDGHRV